MEVAFSDFRQYKVDTDADDGDSPILCPAPFRNQNTGNLSLATTKSVRPLDIYGKPISATRVSSRNAATNANGPAHARLVKRPAKLSIRHSPCRLTQLRPAVRVLWFGNAPHKALCAKSADWRANA